MWCRFVVSAFVLVWDLARHGPRSLEENASPAVIWRLFFLLCVGVVTLSAVCLRLYLIERHASSYLYLYKCT